MTEARSALRELAEHLEVLRRGPHLPPDSRCIEASATLFPRAAPDRPPSRDVLEAVRDELRQVCAAGELENIGSRTLGRAPLVFWDREPQAAAFPGLLDHYLVRAAQRPSLLRNLLEAWLRDFGADRVRHAEVGTATAALLEQTTDPRLAPWAQAHRHFALFDAGRGPQQVGAALLSGPETVAAVLSETGMDQELRADGGFFRETLRRMLDALPAALATPRAAEAWRRAATLLEVQHVTQDRLGREIKIPALRDDKARGDVIIGSLDAWKCGQTHASAPRGEVKAFLLRVVGDPRLKPDRWRVAPEEYARLIRGWLAEASLEAFFALISETNDDPQWRYRRAFWRACLRKMPNEQPAEVWVVLGPGMALRARAVRDLAGGYGTMHASGNAGEQAVLLLRFGNTVMSEWSNVGPVRAWDASDRHCPSLYRQYYQPDALRERCLDFPDDPFTGRSGSHGGEGLYHRFPDRGVWQGRAAHFLKDRVGLHLQPADYMN